MITDDSYKTLKGEAETEYTVKRSRFIARSFGVSSEDEALKAVAAIKQKHFDASHTVYAFILRSGSVKRYSDDGEPQGTAGIPVLNVLEGAGLTDCAVAVTRYFGGTLLGTGGLSRAYSYSAKCALEASEIIIIKKWCVAEISGDYTYFAKIDSLIRSCGGVIINSDFGEKINVEFRIEKEKYQNFTDDLTEAVNGKL